MTKSRRAVFLNAILFVSAIFFLYGGADAATLTWTGASNALWSDPGNWGGTAPVAGDDLFFPGGASNLSNNNDFAAGTSFNSITFSGASGGYNLGGNSINLANGITTSNASGYNTVSLNVTLASSQTFNLSAELDLNGNLDLGPNTLTVNLIGPTCFFQGAISGTGGIIKEGTAELVFSGPSANSYSGTTTVNAGNLRLNKPAGIISIAGPLVIGDGAGGADADRVTLANSSQIGDVAVTINSSGLLDLATFIVTNETVGSVAGSGNIWLGSASLSAGVDNSSTAFSGVVSGTGILEKAGTGTLTLTGVNTATGNLNIFGGSALVDGIWPGTASPQGATLGGAGTVGRIATPNGTVSPGGVGPGILTVQTNGVDLSGGTATFSARLNGAAAGSGYSQLDVAAGSVDLSGATLSASLGFVPIAGQTFTIINKQGAGAVTGTFTGLPEGATLTIGGTQFSISYIGGDGNDVVLTAQGAGAAVAVPAMTAWGLIIFMILAGGGAAYYLRRREAA